MDSGASSQYNVVGMVFRCGSGLGVGLPVRIWKENPETRDVAAGPTQTTEMNGSTVLLHDTLADPKSQTGTLGRFRCKEGFEDVLGLLGINTRASIRDRYRYTVHPTDRGMAIGNPQAESTSLGHRLYGISNQV
jgi:hypothetical protein